MKIHVITTQGRQARHDHIRKQIEKFPEYEIVWHNNPVAKRTERCAALFEAMAMAMINDYNLPYSIVVEDDHFFTSKFSPEVLQAYIKHGEQLQLDVLLGGVESFTGARILHIHDDPWTNIIEVKNFVGTQFCIFYKQFYDRFVQFDHRICPEENLSMRGSVRKAVTYPFISMQADLGSDFGRPEYRTEAFNEGEKRMIDFYIKNYKDALHVR